MIGSMIAAKESFRSYMINSLAKSEHSAWILLISAFMTFTDLSLNRYLSLIGYKDIVQFSAQYLLSGFAINLMASYLTYLGGAVCSTIYMGTIQGFQWFSPALPNLNWIISSLTGILCPVFSLMSMQNIYLNEARLIKDRQKSNESVFGWAFVSICSITIVWFTAGVFSIYPSVIATGSMKPMINSGDITLNKRVNTDSLNIGDIIQFKREGILISHRIVDLVENNNKVYFKTKGDNNSIADAEFVAPEQVKGKVIKTIPKAGWVTLFIKSVHN
jgi:signal peptidase